MVFVSFHLSPFKVIFEFQKLEFWEKKCLGHILRVQRDEASDDDDEVKRRLKFQQKNTLRTST